MEKILLQPGKTSPYVLFDPDKGIFEMRGRLVPENSTAFFKPIIQTLNEFIETYNTKPFEVTICLEYFNTSAFKYLTNIMRILDQHPHAELVTLRWYEEDDEDVSTLGPEETLEENYRRIFPNIGHIEVLLIQDEFE